MTTDVTDGAEDKAEMGGVSDWLGRMPSMRLFHVSFLSPAQPHFARDLQGPSPSSLTLVPLDADRSHRSWSGLEKSEPQSQNLRKEGPPKVCQESDGLRKTRDDRTC